MKNQAFSLTSIVAGAFLLAAPVFAAGDSSSESTEAAAPKCTTGQVMKEKACVAVKGSGLADKDFYDQAVKLATEGQYDWSLQVLAEMKDQGTPEVLNYLGYNNRKAGRVDIAIEHYLKAIALKPDFVQAREYLGEGYVTAGKMDLAKEQLVEIEKVCGKTCKEYEMLAKAIADGKSS
jgi:tetratricopeptide (TPR) repeat protein